MNFIDAIKECDFDKGEYLECAKHTVSFDKCGDLALCIGGNPCEYSFNDVVRWDWEVKSKYLTLDEALAECKKARR